MPRATIGIAFLDEAATLPAAIRSVFAQTEPDWELLLLDDGSADGSLEIARSVRDRRVRVLSDGVNRGLPARLNQITELADAEIVLRMDADDIMHPERLASQLRAFGTRPAADLVCSPAYLIDEAGRPMGLIGEAPIGEDPGRFLFADRVIVHPTVAMRRRWALANPYDERLAGAEDKELFARTHRRSRFHKAEEPLLFYRHVSRYSATRYATHRRIERKILRRLGPQLVGPRRAWTAIGISLGKQAVFRGLDAVGGAEPLYAQLAGRHHRELDPDERRRAEEALAASRAAAVGGW